MDPIQDLKGKTEKLKAKRKTVMEKAAEEQAKGAVVEEAKEERAEKAQETKAAKAAERAEKAAAKAAEKEAREAARRANQQDGIMESCGQLLVFREEHGERVPGRVVVAGTLRVTTAVDTNGTLTLEIIIVREEDKRVFRPMLEMMTMEREDKWNAWFGSTSGLAVNLSPLQRALLKEYVMAQDGAKAVAIQLLRAGFIEEHGIFVAHGHCIDAKGNLVPVDEDGGYPLVCSDGALRVFRLAPEAAIPAPTIKAATTPPAAESTAILKSFLDKMTAYQQDHSGSVAYGWAVASLFHADLLRERRCFPHLYLYGRRFSGKSTLAWCIMASFGMADVRPEAADSIKRNPKATRNLLGDTSGVPMWMDDVRNDDGVDILLNLLRLAFDGSAGRVARRDGQTTVFPVRRGIMVAGQQVIGSDAELRRYVLVDMRNKKNEALYQEVTSGAVAIQPAIVSLMCQRAAIRPAILRYAAQYEQLLFEMGVSREMCWPWGVAMAGLRVAWAGLDDNLAPQHAVPVGAMEYSVNRIKTVREGTSAIQSFWQILEVLDATATPPNSGRNSWGRVIKIPAYPTVADKPGWVEKAGLEKTHVMAIWLGAAHSHVKKSATQVRQSIHTVDALLREFADEPGYLTTVDGVQLDANAPPRRCMLFSEGSPAIPPWVKDAALKNGQPILAV